MPTHDVILGGGGNPELPNIKNLKKKLGRGTLSEAERAIVFPFENILKDPLVLPIADDEQTRRSRRRSQARQRARRGRASTIFTQGEGLGG